MRNKLRPNNFGVSEQRETTSVYFIMFADIHNWRRMLLVSKQPYIDPVISLGSRVHQPYHVKTYLDAHKKGYFHRNVNLFHISSTSGF